MFSKTIEQLLMQDKIPINLPTNIQMLNKSQAILLVLKVTSNRKTYFLITIQRSKAMIFHAAKIQRLSLKDQVLKSKVNSNHKESKTTKKEEAQLHCHQKLQMKVLNQERGTLIQTS
jgi:hypothetical protein